MDSTHPSFVHSANSYYDSFNNNPIAQTNLLAPILNNHNRRRKTPNDDTILLFHPLPSLSATYSLFSSPQSINQSSQSIPNHHPSIPQISSTLNLHHQNQPKPNTQKTLHPKPHISPPPHTFSLLTLPTYLPTYLSIHPKAQVYIYSFLWERKKLLKKVGLDESADVQGSLTGGVFLEKRRAWVVLRSTSFSLFCCLL
jgi:hypothetical protein